MRLVEVVGYEADEARISTFCKVERFKEGVIDMSKNFIDAVKSIRNMWHMNPVTRIHDKNKKDKKKQRREGKEICQKYDYE